MKAQIEYKSYALMKLRCDSATGWSHFIGLPMATAASHVPLRTCCWFCMARTVLPGVRALTWSPREMYGSATWMLCVQLMSGTTVGC